jgi:hypothetical protein
MLWKSILGINNLLSFAGVSFLGAIAYLGVFLVLWKYKEIGPIRQVVAIVSVNPAGLKVGKR